VAHLSVWMRIAGVPHLHRRYQLVCSSKQFGSALCDTPAEAKN